MSAKSGSALKTRLPYEGSGQAKCPSRNYGTGNIDAPDGRDEAAEAETRAGLTRATPQQLPLEPLPRRLPTRFRLGPQAAGFRSSVFYRGNYFVLALF